MRTSWVMVSLAVVGATNALAADAMPAEIRQSGITEDDWRRLTAGEVVVHATPASEQSPESRAEGAVIIKVPWRHAFDQVGRHEEMPEYSSCLKAMEVILKATREGTTMVKTRETHQSLWMTARYTLDYVNDPEKRMIRWSLDPAAQNDIVHMSGSWLFVPLSEQKTLAIYTLSGKSAGALPAVIEDYFKKMMVPGYLQTIRSRVETAHAAGRHGS